MDYPRPLTPAERSAAIDFYLDGRGHAVASARSAGTLGEAAEALRRWITPTRSGLFCPRHPGWQDDPDRTPFEYDTQSGGVQFWRNAPGEDWPDYPPAATITWREMAEHVRATATQLEMFA